MRKTLHTKLFFAFLGLIILFVSGCGGQSDSVKIGVVNLSPRLEPVFNGFKEGMNAFGYVEGENVEYIYDGPASSIEELDTKVNALLAQDVDLIVSISTPATQAAHRLTTDTQTPVVFGPVTDPVAAGVVESVAQPGGNVTGVRLGSRSEGQRLSWLLETVPRIQSIYIPYNPDDASANSSVTAVSDAANELGASVVLREARNDDEITIAINTMPTDIDAILLPQDSLVAARIDDFVTLANERQLPLSSPTDEQVERGALIAYSFRLHELGVQMARLGDQIVQGVAPSDLPVETAEFFLTINLDAAQKIGLEVPDTILQSADTIVR